MKGRERNMATRTGINKQGWEMSEFPVACDKCYGENPFMRMLKEHYGQQCRICFRPFTVFKWKGNKAVYKRTCVCQSCSKDKNICQVCTLDLQFGLPIDLRDRRCGVNGKYLLNQNFLSEDNQATKPPRPPLPPSKLTKADLKELVFVPEQPEINQQENRGMEGENSTEREREKQDQEDVEAEKDKEDEKHDQEDEKHDKDREVNEHNVKMGDKVIVEDCGE